MDYGFTDILTLLGSLGLFLYGMKVMSDALMELAGNRMRNISWTPLPRSDVSRREVICERTRFCTMRRREIYRPSRRQRRISRNRCRHAVRAYPGARFVAFAIFSCTTTWAISIRQR